MEQDTPGWAYSLWPVVILNIGLVLVFVLSFLAPRRRVECRSMGLFAAWIAALVHQGEGPLAIQRRTTCLKTRRTALPLAEAWV